MQLVSALFFWQNQPENEVGKKSNPISEKGDSPDDTDDDRIYIKIPARPEQTPAMILSSALLVKRLAIIKLLSDTLQVFVRLNE